MCVIFSCCDNWYTFDNSIRCVCVCERKREKREENQKQHLRRFSTNRHLCAYDMLDLYICDLRICHAMEDACNPFVAHKQWTYFFVKLFAMKTINDKRFNKEFDSEWNHSINTIYYIWMILFFSIYLPCLVPLSVSGITFSHNPLILFRILSNRDNVVCVGEREGEGERDQYDLLPPPYPLPFLDTSVRHLIEPNGTHYFHW